LEIERLRSFLRSHKLIALDTCIFIYQWEDNRRYSPLTDCIFDWIEHSKLSAVTSTITMTELLVHPYRSRNERRAKEVFGLLSSYPNLRWIAPSLEIAAAAARIRAQHSLRTADALQAATAAFAHASAFVTNDTAFKRIGDIEVLLLDRYA
jgi:predicted nucleic acid-binding protein